MTSNQPPRWAEAILRLLLAPRDRQSVTGDLLEAYRDRAVPERGAPGADLWYLGQVAGFAARSSGAWTLLLAAAFIGRTALDWVSPTTDFHARSLASTLFSAGVFVCAGLAASWRSHDVRSGTIAGALTALFSVAIDWVGTVVLLAVWHDPSTFSAIEGSGGLAEVLILPIVHVLPGAVLGTVGGLFGGALHKLSTRPA